MTPVAQLIYQSKEDIQTRSFIGNPVVHSFFKDE